jgi:hypothetical protein
LKFCLCSQNGSIFPQNSRFSLRNDGTSEILSKNREEVADLPVYLLFHCLPGIPMKIVLELLDQSSSVRRITVRHDIVIGRGSDCNVRLSAPQVSRRHCFLRVGREGVSISDLDSSNGTWVNGIRLASGVRRELADGTQISLGPVRFLVHVRPEAVSGNVLPGGLLNEEITESAGSSAATTLSGREQDSRLDATEPRASSVQALQATIEDVPHAADSRLEIVELGRQLAGGASAEDAVVFAPGQSSDSPRRDRLDAATTAHDIDLRAMASLDGVDVLDPGVLSGQFPPDRPMWSRDYGHAGDDSEAPLPPTLRLNPWFPDKPETDEESLLAAESADHESSPDIDQGREADVEPAVAVSEDDSATDLSPGADDESMGPELSTFLKGL